MLRSLLYRAVQYRGYALPEWMAPDRAFHGFRPWRGTARAGFEYNYAGQAIDVTFADGWDRPGCRVERCHVGSYPKVSEELFEWIALCSALRRATGRFTMIEGGAGFGRWLVAAACLARRARPDLELSLIAAEAEPSHFEMLRKHFADNGLDPDAHRLLRAAVAGRDGEVQFTVGDAKAWWGQAIVDDDNNGRWTLETVPAISIETLIGDAKRVDLLDFDVQGAEADAVEAGIAVMTARVRRAFISTHSEAIERALHRVFSANGWRRVHRYRLGKRQWTRYGWVTFGDGVEHWVNPAV